MLQILYTQDHAERGKALGSAGGASHNGLVSTAPITKTGLDTLVFWGHGTFASLCDLHKQPIVDLVKSWKRLNPTLKTVEIITCNSRHAPAGYDAFAKQMKDGLRTGFRSGTRNIKVKALPVTVSGALNAHSILLAHAPNKSWCYITAPGPTDSTMMQATTIVKAEAGKIGYDLAQAGNNVANTHRDRKFTLNFGYFNTLRSQLGEV